MKPEEDVLSSSCVAAAIANSIYKVLPTGNVAKYMARPVFELRHFIIGDFFVVDVGSVAPGSVSGAIYLPARVAYKCSQSCCRQEMLPITWLVQFSSGGISSSVTSSSRTSAVRLLAQSPS